MKSKVYLAPVLAFILAVGLSFVVFYDRGPEKDIKAQYLQGGEFEFFNAGEPIKLSDFGGQPVILYFGYTYCPDVCPVGLATIRDALNSRKSDFSGVKAIFVTLDPERDTTERLKEYTGFFHPNIVALTGSLDEIVAVTKPYGTYFKKMPPDESGSYTVDHTAYYYLIDAKGELTRVMDHNASAEQIAAELAKLI